MAETNGRVAAMAAAMEASHSAEVYSALAPAEGSPRRSSYAVKAEQYAKIAERARSAQQQAEADRTATTRMVELEEKLFYAEAELDAQRASHVGSRTKAESTLEVLAAEKASLEAKVERLGLDAEETARRHATELERVGRALSHERERSAKLEARLMATADQLTAAQAAAVTAKQRRDAATARLDEVQIHLLEREAALATAEEALSALLARSGPAQSSSSEPLAARHKVAGAAPTSEEACRQSTGNAGTPPASAPQKPGPFLAAVPPRPAGHAPGVAPRGDDDDCVAELVAEQLIAGAKSDSLLTNPAMAIANMIDYVQEWRDAFDPTGGATPSNLEHAAPSVQSTRQVSLRPSAAHGPDRAVETAPRSTPIEAAHTSAAIRATPASTRERTSALLYAS